MIVAETSSFAADRVDGSRDATYPAVMAWPPTIDPWHLAVSGAFSWLMLGIVAANAGNSWFTPIVLLVLYLFLQVMFQGTRRNCRLPRRRRHWLFIP